LAEPIATIQRGLEGGQANKAIAKFLPLLALEKALDQQMK